MHEIIRSNDVVLLSFAESLMRDAGIASMIADQSMSILEGSLGMLQRRLLVDSDCVDQARRILTDAGLGAAARELEPVGLRFARARPGLGLEHDVATADVPAAHAARVHAVFRRRREATAALRLALHRHRGQDRGALGQRLFRLMLDTASGLPTCSEELGYGDSEFVPWQIGATM